MGGDLNSFRDIKHFVKWRGWGLPPRDTQGSPRSMSLNAPYLKEQENMVYGWGSERFLRYHILWNEGGRACPQGTPWGPWSMSLNVPHHKEEEYIWLMGGDLNSFQDIKHFVKWRGWGMLPGDTRGPKIYVTKCALSWGTRIYMVYGWGSERFPRYYAFY